MGPGNLLRLGMGAGALLCLVGCPKKNAEVPTSANAAAKDEGSAARAADDKTAPPGVDLSKLDGFERTVFFRVLNKEASACGKAHSLMRSLKEDKSCRKSLYAARYVARLVDGGYTDSEIAESIDKRFRQKTMPIDLEGVPVKGNPNAPVAIVEFVDYECPHCKFVQPVLRQILEEYPEEVKVYFKNYPLGTHTNARQAAEAAMAAHKQGKFWPFSDKVWANSDALTPAVLERIAKEVGLDVDQWRADAASPATQSRVQADRDEGRTLGIEATPTIYVNGRKFTDPREVESLRDWVSEALNR